MPLYPVIAHEESKPSGSLATLPPELLGQIVAHIETARVLAHLSTACRRIRTFVEKDGFRVFVQSRFPYVQPPTSHSPSFWRDAAHGMTTLSRNWDRKAFLAWSIDSRSEVRQDTRRQRAYFRSGQTMGFVPVIDSYETWYGENWTARKEVVAWGAGAELVMYVKTMGGKAKDMWEATTNKNMRDFNAHQHRITWAKFHEKGAVEGRDDITSLNIIPHGSLDDSEKLVTGRASGGLSLISLTTNTPGDRAEVLSSYFTNGRPVRSATISPGDQPLLAACLSDSTVAVYPIESTLTQVGPTGETQVIKSGHSGRTWSSHFLGRERLAVGFGPTKEPIHVYNISRGELMHEHARSLALLDTDRDSRLDIPEIDTSSATSIYSLAPIPASSLAGGMGSDIFLSGAYDGFTRYASRNYFLNPSKVQGLIQVPSLHDLRTLHSTVAVFRDPVDTFSPIYSLLPIGTERFVAGGARHSIIKVFDTRMPGGKLYHAADLDPCSEERLSLPKKLESAKHSGCCIYHYEAKYCRRGWNVFLNTQSNGNRRDSPVYALSRPSQHSPSFFAGIEGHIIKFDMVSIMDQHPDPVFKNGPVQTGERSDLRRKWNPQRKVTPLPMYEHDTGPVSLLRQRAEVEHSENSIRPGWDERWSHQSYR